MGPRMRATLLPVEHTVEKGAAAYSVNIPSCLKDSGLGVEVWGLRLRVWGLTFRIKKNRVQVQ